MLVQSLKRIRKWSGQEINATPPQFRKMLPPSRSGKDTVRLAISAGKKMARQLAKAGNTVKNLDREQVERWRVAYNVPLHRVNVMLMVAWSSLHYPKALRVAAAKRARKDAAIGLAEPQDVAKQMLAQYGSLAESTIRSLMKQSADKTEWKKVLHIVQSRSGDGEIKFKFAGEVITIPVLQPLQTPASLARQGAAKYRGYLARQQKFLRNIPTPKQTVQPVMAPPRRLVSEAEMAEPSMCISCTFKNHFHRNPVRFGGTVFCESCQPSTKGE